MRPAAGLPALRRTNLCLLCSGYTSCVSCAVWGAHLLIKMSIGSACLPGLPRRIVLKSNCDTPIDVWLVSGHHQTQQEEEEEELQMGHPHASMTGTHVKHEADDMAGGLQHRAIKASCLCCDANHHRSSLLQRPSACASLHVQSMRSCIMTGLPAKQFGRNAVEQQC